MRINSSNPTAQNFLVQKLKISNKSAMDIILKKRMTINGKTAFVKQPISLGDQVELDGCVLKEIETYTYLAYYKPRGIETTLNKQIKDNLADALLYPSRVFPVGRLDKESEGLLLLTNDGTIFNKIIHYDQQQEKEYIVRVNQLVTKEFLSTMASGVSILGKFTKPAKVLQIDPYTFSIILTQGLNRQIRRMCFKLGYNVVTLQRIRIINIHLNSLLPGEWRQLTKEEISGLSKSIGDL